MSSVSCGNVTWFVVKRHMDDRGWSKEKLLTVELTVCDVCVRFEIVFTVEYRLQYVYRKVCVMVRMLYLQYVFTECHFF